MAVDVRERELGQVYTHSLICWPSVLAGALIAVGLGMMFNVLGVAIGASAFDPTAPLRGQARSMTLAAGVWVLIATAVAMEIGAYVAARSAKFPDYRHGLFQGVTVWAVAVLMFSMVAGLSLNGAAEDTTMAMMAPQAAAPLDNSLGAAANSVAPSAAPEAVSPRPMTRSEAEAAARAARDTLAVTSWWTLATLVLGLVGALIGARLGAAHPADWPRTRVYASPYGGSPPPTPPM